MPIHGAFHEGCTIDIGNKIITAIQPHWLRIGGYWFARGGLPIDVSWQTGMPPEGLWLPDQGVPPQGAKGNAAGADCI